jgi:hypothetical protein
MPTVVVLRETIDATGKLKDVQMEKENPPGTNRSPEAIRDVRNLTFLPAFRNGRPVESVTHVNFMFIPADWNWK